MAPFRPLNDNELSALTDEELIAYQAAARQTARPNDAMRAMGHLIDRYRDRVRYWVWRKVPESDIDDVVSAVTESALKSVLDGTATGQYVKWLRTITERRIADHFRRSEGDPKLEPLPEEHRGDEEIWGEAGMAPDHADDVVSDVAGQKLIQAALEHFNDVHQLVIRLAGPIELGFDNRPGREVAEIVNDQVGDQLNDPMTDVNVYKIISRFRQCLGRLRFEEDEG